MKVKTQCRSCRGTGLYRGMAEPKGVAVLCLNCGGTGCSEIEYTPFTERQRRDDVATVRLSRGSFILSCGPVGSSVTYAEFLSGTMPVSNNILTNSQADDRSKVDMSQYSTMVDAHIYVKGGAVTKQDWIDVIAACTDQMNSAPDEATDGKERDATTH